jgi:hypothetical protein
MSFPDMNQASLEYRSKELPPSPYCSVLNFFLIRLAEGGGVESNWVHSPPSDYDDGEFGGMMIGKGNRSTRRKPAPVQICLPQIPHDLTGLQPGPPRWEASD